ncbi:MAG TPA: hypothetical protein V6C58_25420 [Allocoleopsis sp.]
MPVNTTFNPSKVEDFDKSNLTFNAQAAAATVPGYTTRNIDLVLTEDHLITGAWVVTTGGNPGDKMSLQIIDTNGTFTGIAGTMINQFVTNWFPGPNSDINLDMVYPAKLLGGMTVRLVYQSIGISAPFVAINYKLHKVLI